MIVFKDFFFPSVRTGLLILPKAERERERGRGEEKKSENEKLFC